MNVLASVLDPDVKRPYRDLGAPVGSRPAKRRPVVVIQANSFNASRLSTVLVAVISSNTALATMPGNTFLPALESGLPRDAVVNSTALVTLNQTDLDEVVGVLPERLMATVAAGLRVVLGL